MFGFDPFAAPPKKGTMPCPWCKRNVTELLSSPTHDWLCHKCRQGFTAKGERVEISRPTKPVEKKTEDRRKRLLPIDKPKSSR